MFRILLELNDLSLLRKLKPQLTDEVLHMFRELAGDWESSTIDAGILRAESDDDAVDKLAGRLYRFYRFLRARRLKLHGFVLGLDYRGAREKFSFLPDILWGGAWKSDSLVISEAAYPVLAPFFSLVRSPAGWKVEEYLEQIEHRRRPFYLAADKANLSQVEEILNEPGAGSRPCFIHSLLPEEQYRLAAAAAEDPADPDTFLLVDLNYPWRSVPAAWLNAFEPEAVEKLSSFIPESRREAWLKRGGALRRGALLFNDFDLLAWYGETLTACLRRAKAREGRVTLALVGADRLDRFGRRLTERVLAPLHRREGLRLVLLAAGKPRGALRRLDGVEFRRARARGNAASREQLSGEDSVILDIAARFAPFFDASELHKRLYEAGFPKHQVDQLFAAAGERGELFRTWRYYFLAPRISYARKQAYNRSSIEPFIRQGEAAACQLYLIEYAAIAAAETPRAGERLYVGLLRSLYERGFGRGGREALALLESVRSYFPGYGTLARGMDAAFRESKPNLGGLSSLPAFTSEDPYGVSSLGMTLETEALLRAGDVDSALSLAKSFLYRVQEGGQACQIAQSHNAIGAAMLRQGRVEEAADYFSLAYEAAKGCPSVMDKIKARSNQAAAQFLFGNYSKAAGLLREALRLAPGISYGPYLLNARFLLARTAFVLGRYEEAEAELWQALSLATLVGAPHGLFYAWIARSQIYSGRIKAGLELLATVDENPEILHYRAEGLFFNGSTAEALEASRRAERLLKRGGTRESGGFGRFAWGHGYQNLEDAAFRDEAGRGVLDNQITVFRLYLESLCSGERGGREILERITRSGRLSEYDPHLHYYYLLHGLIIPDSTHDETLERITYLSKGLKHLQRIAALIDDVQCRLDFTQKNRWNRRLVELSREEKLI